MSLAAVPIELLYMVADHLPLRDHSALTLASRHFASALQSRLRSRLRQLPLQDPGSYALLALHWCAASGDHAQLRSLLEHIPGILAINTARTAGTVVPKYHRRRRPAPPPPNYTSASPFDDSTWDWVHARGHHLCLMAYPMRKFNPHCRSRRGMTSVEYALSNGYHGLLRLALSKETDRQNAHQAVSYAARYGSLESSKIVLSAFRATFGTAAWELAQQEWVRIVVRVRGVSFFYEDGKTIHLRDAAGRTLLHRAVTGGFLGPPGEPAGTLSHPEAVYELLQKGADVNARDKAGMTALHIAAAAMFIDIVELLLQAGADADLADEEGCTPVHAALRTERPERWAVAAMLQESGANFGIADGKGVVARDLIDGPRALRSSARQGKRKMGKS